MEPYSFDLDKVINKYEFKSMPKKAFVYQQPRQLLLRNFISKNTIYDNILLYHDLGVGKSCSAISIAEGFKEYLSDMNRKVLVLVKNDNIKKNFVDELFKTGCTHNAYFDEELKREYNNADAQKKEEILNKVIRRINKVYQFMTYGTFANSVFGIKQYVTTIDENIERKFVGRKEATIMDLSNTVIIIDEVHNVTNNIYYKAIMEVLKHSYNYRLVLLTATPMYDNATEIFEISNLLNANNPSNLLPIKEKLFKPFMGSEPILTKLAASSLGLLNTNQIDITETGKKLLKKNLKGKVSFFAVNTESFPKKIDMGTPLLKDTPFSMNIIECEMSDYQSEVYREALMTDKQTFEEYDLSIMANNIESSAEIEDDSSSMFHNTSSASTLVYPNKMYGERGFLASFDIKKRKGVESYKIKEEFNSMLKLDGDLAKYSNKLYTLLLNANKLQDQPGLVFIYSNYVKYNGAEILRQVFSENGYSEFKSESDSVKSKTFVIFDSRFNSSQRKSILNLYNSPKNKNGDFIKIIIGSPIISEGINLKNTRQVHILEPSWNMSRINQIVGRAIRFKSHELLEPEYRNVEVFKYVSIAKTIESIDKQKYILSEYKDRSNKKIERYLKEIAIDCDINTRIKQSGKDGSAECDYTSCDYKCDTKPSDKLDKSTYKLYLDFFDKFDIEYTTSVIKEMFNEYFVWSLKDIISRIKNVSIESVYYALNSLIDNKIIISDSFNRDGFLIQKGDYIIFNPIDKDISTSLFAKTLDFEHNINKYTLEDYAKIKGVGISQEETGIKKKKVGVELSDVDLEFNDKMIREHDIFGTYRTEGIDGKFGPVDNFFRIVDLRKFKREAESDNRKIPSGMRITSKTIKDLKDIIKYLKINKEFIKKTVEDPSKLKQKELSIIIEAYLKEHNLILH
jgi:superfamily II DNA or RNA helicase